jgi:hypothetical protein
MESAKRRGRNRRWMCLLMVVMTGEQREGGNETFQF